MSTSVLVVINPVSGESSQKLVEQTISSWKKLQDREVYVYKTTGQNDEQTIANMVRDKQAGTVIACGGDGTLLMAARVCRNTDVALGLIPTGSANGMAAELNIPQDPGAALEVIDEGKVIESDMLLFNGEHLGIHISDMGLNAAIVQRFESSERRGFFAYTQGLLQEVTQMNSFAVTLHCDGEKEKHECLMVAFANARYYGTGAALNRIGRINDGRFEVCLLHNISLTKVVSHFFESTGKDSDHLTVRQCQKVEVEAAHELPFQIDGEVMPQRKKVSVEIIPGCLKLIVPKEARG